MKKLGVSNSSNEYFMDIETRIVYINNGVKVSSGTIYVLEEREIFPVVLAVEQIERGFKLIATADEKNEQISSYHFYINNELYRTISTSQKSVSIEVTAENYYIKGKTDMELFRDSVNNGNSTNTFQGTFEGNNHEIQNMYNVGTTEEYQGLFGYINNATIQNIKIASGEIQGSQNCGGVIGRGANSKITNCNNAITIKVTNGYKGMIELCYNSGILKAPYLVIGGVIGWYNNAEAIVQNCYTRYNMTIDSSKLWNPIIGNPENANMTGCYYLGTTTSGIERTEADMKTIDFINLIGGTTYWKLDSSNKNDGFVILQWQ